MGGIDPNVVMLDQIVRVVVGQVIQAAVWCAVGVFFIKRFLDK